MTSIHTLEGLVSLPRGMDALQRRWMQLLDAEQQLAAAREECSKRIAQLRPAEEELWSWLGDKIEPHAGDFDDWWRDASDDERENARELLSTLAGKTLSWQRTEHELERQWLDVCKDRAIAMEDPR